MFRHSSTSISLSLSDLGVEDLSLLNGLIMVKYVVKRDGIREPFDIEKLRRSIIVNAQDARLSEKRVKEVTKKILYVVVRFVEENEKELTTAEIKKKILIEFDTVEPSVSKVWREFDEKRGVTIV